MPILEKPAPNVIRRIYSVLVCKPHCLEDLAKTTGIDSLTLNQALRFLKEKGMIVSYDFTGRLTFRMVRTQPARYGWNFPWLDLMMSTGDWKAPWKSVVNGTVEEGISEKLDKRFVKLLRDLLVDPNLDLIEVLEELKMTDVPLEVFKLHNQEPYCLECLRKEQRFVRMILCEASEEHCCPNCGVVRETLLVKRR
jgi:hypothetical protein